MRVGGLQNRLSSFTGYGVFDSYALPPFQTTKQRIALVDVRRHPLEGEFGPIRRREMRPMALRELGPRPLRVPAIRDRARCDRRTVRERSVLFGARRSWRRR